MIERDAAVDDGDGLPGAEEAVVVPNLREPGQTVSAGERLLDIAQQRFDVAFAVAFDPEIGVRIRVMNERGRLFRKTAVMLDHRHVADERLPERDHRADGTRRHHAAVFQQFDRPILRLASP